MDPDYTAGPMCVLITNKFIFLWRLNSLRSDARTQTTFFNIIFVHRFFSIFLFGCLQQQQKMSNIFLNDYVQCPLCCRTSLSTPDEQERRNDSQFFFLFSLLLASNKICSIVIIIVINCIYIVCTRAYVCVCGDLYFFIFLRQWMCCCPPPRHSPLPHSAMDFKNTLDFSL